jgi:hypothetical protein
MFVASCFSDAAVTSWAGTEFRVAELVNLNKARKARARAAERAAENRVRFGRGKAETLAAKLEAERARRELEGKKRDD